jgi:hypothetical protein
LIYLVFVFDVVNLDDADEGTPNDHGLVSLADEGDRLTSSASGHCVEFHLIEFTHGVHNLLVDTAFAALVAARHVRLPELRHFEASVGDPFQSTTHWTDALNALWANLLDALG